MFQTSKLFLQAKTHLFSDAFALIQVVIILKMLFLAKK